MSFIVGIILSIIFSKWLLPDTEGECPRYCPTLYPLLYKGMIFIPNGNNKAYHIHHWILGLLLCIYAVNYKVPDIIVGFAVGMIIQGLTYSDWLQIKVPNPY